MRRLLIVGLLGISLGLGYAPMADFAAEHYTYGADDGYVFNDMQCMSLAMGVIPEVSMAKTLGVSKRRYMEYVRSALDFNSLTPEQRAVVGRFFRYLDELWLAKDGGAKVIDQCFARAAKSVQPILL